VVFNKLAAFRTADDAAQVARMLLNEGDSLSQVWRFAILQMLDDYSSVLRHRGLPAAADMWTTAPGRAGDVRVDAALASLAEHLARRDGWRVPSWAREPGREAIPWWFVTELRGLHPRALVESPSSFRRRGVFITSDALERV
jgi:hypothetical protein